MSYQAAQLPRPSLVTLRGHMVLLESDRRAVLCDLLDSFYGMAGSGGLGWTKGVHGKPIYLRKIRVCLEEASLQPRNAAASESRRRERFPREPEPPARRQKKGVRPVLLPHHGFSMRGASYLRINLRNSQLLINIAFRRRLDIEAPMRNSCWSRCGTNTHV